MNYYNEIKEKLIKDDLSEYALKQLLLNNLDDFLNQLGIGFNYVGNEYKIKIDDRIIAREYELV